MAHPGMAAIAGELRDRGDGTYDSRIRFSMAGDWVIIVNGELPDGTPITRTLDRLVVGPTR